MNNLILGVNTALKPDWSWKRADGLFGLPNRQVIPTDLGDVVFHYSIPAIQESGDGAVEPTSEIKSNKHQIDGGELLVSKLNPRKGCVILSKKQDYPTVASTEFIVLAPKLIDPDFAVFLYQSHQVRESISSVVQSVTRSHQRANPSDITKLWLPIPPLPLQRRIAAHLDRETARIDALVAEKEALLRLLEEKRASLISHAVTRGLNPKAKPKPSGIPWLGDVPEHWEIRRLRFLLKGSMKYGANESALSEDPDHPRFIRITDLNPDGSLRPETFKSLSPELAAPYLLKNGDILFARTGATVGKALIYRESMGPACYAGYLIRARLKQELLLPEFLFQFTQSAIYWEQIRLGTIQATIQNFSAEKYAEMLVPLPPTISEQQHIIDFVVSSTLSIQSVITDIQTSIQLLREKRTSLISAAVTGEMVVG